MWKAYVLKVCLPLISVIVFGMLCSGCRNGAAVSSDENSSRVGVGEFSQMLEQGDLVLLDVRTPEEFAAGHIPGARNLDVHSPAFASALENMTDERGFLVYCRSGRRSAKACGLMTEAGLDQVFDLEPGFNGWKAAGKAVER